ncbi:MAG: hypothetical protein KKD64_16645 [Alphaproteobacteria bacterium]|nr:hypothetical protein [Alphaproteobacteria bacterium]MBU0795467.1 hypothetical protein [Alphaproteobacteria bacterium]MBU0875339.1 hypothetical protein [Alphaproteobacteria bacterium]MBU1771269.1 hypothetical protein [Alphaproteobacteria bacterium]
MKALLALGIGMMMASAGYAQPDTPETAVSDVVITAQLARMQIALGRDPQGRVTCATTISSGDLALDEAICKRAARCMKKKPQPAEVLSACVDKQKATFQRLIAERGL